MSDLKRERIFLVAQVGYPGSLVVLEKEATYLPEHKCWNVNMRGPECGSKLIQSVPEEKVYRTRELAEKRLLELAPEEDKLR